MSQRIRIAAVIAGVIFTIGAILAVVDDRLVLGGTLLLFTAFSIYVHETHR